MKAYKIPLLAGLLILSACTANPILQDAKVSVEIPDKWSSIASQYKDFKITWLEGFKDPLMLALIEEGRNNNPDLILAAGNMNKAWLLAAKSATSLMPSADLSLGQSSEGTSTVKLTANWELDVWGRISAGNSAAEASAKAAEADYIFTQQSISANIAKLYFKIVEANLQTDLAKKNLAISKETIRITKVKYDNGISSGQDLALSRANLAASEEQVIRLAGSQKDAMRALEILLGRYPSASLESSKILPALPANPPAGLPSELLERRPDLISAEQKIAAAFNAGLEAKAASLPRFSLTANGSGASSSLAGALNPSDLAWQMGANLIAPLFDGGRRKIDIKLANLEQKQSIANYAKIALNAFAEVENNLDQGIVLKQRELALIQVQIQSHKAYRIAKIRYDEGEIDLLEPLTLQNQANAAESNLSSVRRSLLEQRINLYLALGGAWQTAK